MHGTRVKILGDLDTADTVRTGSQSFGTSQGQLGSVAAKGQAGSREIRDSQGGPEARYWAAKWNTSEVKHECYYSREVLRSWLGTRNRPNSCTPPKSLLL